ncbi:DUF2631 domain-containing protein [Gordonia amarae]|uniref:DUF2631 domain-containing protein n=2 Tax=Gordonia amarae TaxID=36821 RepID=G7GU79_9ACTN|nr:DUF2631 domain-containing protein [Gordonia amarae]MCS3878654.1 putative membrane protein [Gordonia amarae]QHN17246.1 DUF2631 domain-containing protein [Gordonia amarae]QHN21772.1 DUF2631 domain-containing protein [Gordonia amarae]QHN30623.1 DUF2631 domain-containing protein [Gordonia amarae]QHN39400.1 DUF2631 domain-containing protein [Gordonia amarae]
MASTEVEHEHVDTGWTREPVDAPSARFGWHARPKRTYFIAGWFSVLFLLFMGFVGNHKGQVEVLWSIGIAACIAVFLIRGQFFNRDPKWLP